MNIKQFGVFDSFFREKAQTAKCRPIFLKTQKKKGSHYKDSGKQIIIKRECSLVHLENLIKKNLMASSTYNSAVTKNCSVKENKNSRRKKKKQEFKHQLE